MDTHGDSQGSDIPAATLYKGKGHQVAAFGFPLETSAQMGEVIKGVLKFLSFARFCTKKSRPAA